MGDRGGLSDPHLGCRDRVAPTQRQTTRRAAAGDPRLGAPQRGVTLWRPANTLVDPAELIVVSNTAFWSKAGPLGSEPAGVRAQDLGSATDISAGGSVVDPTQICVKPIAVVFSATSLQTSRPFFRPPQDRTFPLACRPQPKSNVPHNTRAEDSRLRRQFAPHSPTLAARQP